MLGNIHKNFSLHAYNTFGIAARCRYFISVEGVDQLADVLRDTGLKNTAIMILGGGSNVLFTKDYDGLVIKNSIEGIEVLDEDNTKVLLKVGSGVVWHHLVMHCVENGWGGIENLSLIPGLVGAAPMQNIGAYGVEFESVFQSLEAMHLQTREVTSFSKSDCEFGYRTSIFKTKLKNQFVITSVTLSLAKRHKFKIEYGAIQETLEKHGVSKLSIKAVSDAVIEIRSGKLPDPKEIGNAGSFFKNPVVANEHYQRIRKAFPQMPHFSALNNMEKIPAGWLIEQCGE